MLFELQSNKLNFELIEQQANNCTNKTLRLILHNHFVVSEFVRFFVHLAANFCNCF